MAQVLTPKHSTSPNAFCGDGGLKTGKKRLSKFWECVGKVSGFRELGIHSLETNRVVQMNSSLCRARVRAPC